MGLRSRRAPISRGLIPQVAPQRAASPTEAGFTVRQTNIQRFGSSRVDSRGIGNEVGKYVQKQEDQGISDAETFLLENPAVYTRALDFAKENPGTDSIKSFLQSGELKEEDAPTNARYLQTALARRAFMDFRAQAVQGLDEFNFSDDPQVDPQAAAAKILANSFDGTLDHAVFEDFIGSREFGRMRSAFESEFMAAAQSQIRKQQVEFNKGEFRQEVNGRISTALRETSEGRTDYTAAQEDLEKLYQQSRSLFNDSRVEFWKATEGSLLSPANDTPEEVEEALRYAHSALGDMQTKPGLIVSEDQADAGRGRTNAEEFSAIIDKLEARKERLQSDDVQNRAVELDRVKNDLANILFPALSEIEEGPASERTAAILELERSTIENYSGPEELRGRSIEYIQGVAAAAQRQDAPGSEQAKFEALNILNRESPAEAQAYLDANRGAFSGPDFYVAQETINKSKEFSKYLHRHDSISALDAQIGSYDNAGSGLSQEQASQIQAQALEQRGQLLEDFRQRLVNGNVNDEAFLQEYNKDLRAAVQAQSQSVSQSAAQARQETIGERQKVLDFHGGNLPVGPGVIDGLNLPDAEKQSLKAQNARLRDRFSQAVDSTFDRQVLRELEDVPGLSNLPGQLRGRKIKELRSRFHSLASQGSEATASERLRATSERALPLFLQELTGISADVGSEAESRDISDRVRERDSFINPTAEGEESDFTKMEFYREGVASADALASALDAPIAAPPGAPPGAGQAQRFAQSLIAKSNLRSGLEGDRPMKAISSAYAAMGETDEAKRAVVSYLSVSGFRLEEIEQGYVNLQGKDILDSKQLLLTPDLIQHPESIHIQITSARLAELSEDKVRLKKLLDTIGHPSDEENAKKFISTQNRWIAIRKSRR